MNRLLSPAVISLFLLTFGLPVAQALPPQNGDFTSFAGWQGYLYDGTSSTAVDPATDSPHYSLLGSGPAQLMTKEDAYYDVSLEQTFDLPANALEIIFLHFGWHFTSVVDPPGIDFSQAVLTDNVGNNILLDLLNGVVPEPNQSNTGTATTAIGSLAGGNVTLRFELQDGDFDEQDTFRIGNIRITQSSLSNTHPRHATAVQQWFARLALGGD